MTTHELAFLCSHALRAVPTMGRLVTLETKLRWIGSVSEEAVGGADAGPVLPTFSIGWIFYGEKVVQNPKLMYGWCEKVCRP